MWTTLYQRAHLQRSSLNRELCSETTWSLNTEDTAYTVDASRAARANVNSVWIMAALMKTCGKHYHGGPAPSASPIRCRGSKVTAAVN